MLVDHAENMRRDLFHRPGRVDAYQDALVGVEGDQRRRLGVVDLETVPDHLFLVIVALEELVAAVVAGVLLRLLSCGHDLLQTPVLQQFESRSDLRP